MLAQHDYYDWTQAFNFASFDIEDVAEVIAESAGENDGERWISFGRLKDGRFYFLEAWCDYTGWDCQSGGHSYESDDRADVERMGMGDDDRKRLGIVLPPSPPRSPIPDID